MIDVVLMVGGFSEKSISVFYDKDQQVNAEIWVDKRRIHFVLQSIISNILNQMDYAGDLWFNIDLRKSGENRGLLKKGNFFWKSLLY